jgi:hypothetical protein
MGDLLDGGLGAAREKFKTLFTHRLEWIHNEDLDKEWKEITKKSPEDLPFFSEVALYSLLGKDNARTVLGLLRSLGEALGFTSMEMERSFRVDEEKTGKDLPDQDDLDAFEVLLRNEASFLFDGDSDRILPLMRGLGLMRQIVGAKELRDGVEYVRCYPEDLRVGDRIVRRGQMMEILGFLDKDGNGSDVPVPDPVKDDDREVYDRKLKKRVKKPYWGAHVKLHEDDDHGWAVRSQDEYVVQRKVDG